MVELQQAAIATSDQPPRLLQLQADITTKMNELAATITAMLAARRAREKMRR